MGSCSWTPRWHDYSWNTLIEGFFPGVAVGFGGTVVALVVVVELGPGVVTPEVFSVGSGTAALERTVGAELIAGAVDVTPAPGAVPPVSIADSDAPSSLVATATAIATITASPPITPIQTPTLGRICGNGSDEPASRLPISIDGGGLESAAGVGVTGGRTGALTSGVGTTRGRPPAGAATAIPVIGDERRGSNAEAIPFVDDDCRGSNAAAPTPAAAAAAAPGAAAATGAGSSGACNVGASSNDASADSVFDFAPCATSLGGRVDG